MRLETYSLDLEDLILFAMLRDIREGFYIDIGANDPLIDSVTKFFYDRGWHGINIEPAKKFFMKFQSSIFSRVSRKK